ncbi:zinc-finger domain-containing protein [Cytobacillus firmus]|nr:zinc-finger domain-containing protein [Cytobacillus firmus]
MNRKDIYNEVEAIMDYYCTECFLYKNNRQEKGRNYAHRFCITKCTVGETIKQHGQKLSRY